MINLNIDRKILIISITGLIFGLLLLLVPKKYTTMSESYRLYKYGLSLSKDKDYQNAYYNFGKIGKNSKIYPFAIYRQAICAKELNDTKSAIKKYRTFTKIIKDDNLAPVGYWELGELYYGSKNYSKASKYFNTLQKKYPQSDFAYAANFRLGEIFYEKKPETAQKYFIRYIDHAPKGRFSIPATENLDSNNLNEEEKLILAISLFENDKNEESIGILNSINSEGKWYYLGKNYLKIKKNDLAKEAFLKNLQTMKTEDGSRINDSCTNYATLSGGTKNDAYTKLLASVKNPVSIPGILFNHAQNLPRSTVIKNYQRIYAHNPQSFYAAESLWEIFWNLYKQNKYKEALKIAQNHNLKFPNANSAPKILYFAGKIHLKTGDKIEADKFFKKVFDTYPDSYYAYRANENLNREKEPFKTIKNIKLEEQSKVIKLPISSKNLSELLLVQDFETIESFKIQDEFLKSWLARVKSNPSYSILLARDEMAKISNKPDIKDSKWKLIYPVYYYNTINLMAENSRLSPQLLIAIMKEESFFDVNAKSPVGAAGLMQLMPQTAQFIDNQGYSLSKLNEPYYNTYLGAKYFASLVKQFEQSGGSEMFAVASYNGGPGNIIKWKSEFFNGDYDDFVEDIPYFETQSYIKKIFASYWNYLRIYYK